MTAGIGRAALLCVAVVIAAWFALLLRQSDATSRASVLLARAGRPTSAEARHVLSLLRVAGELNPDRGVDVLRAELYREQGDLARARAILKRVVAAEPENLDAWIWLARSSPGDPRDFYTAAFRIRQLVRALPSR